jgi:hypothetical protein
MKFGKISLARLSVTKYGHSFNIAFFYYLENSLAYKNELIIILQISFWDWFLYARPFQ